MSSPAAREGDPHTCPLCDGSKPHVGGKITSGKAKVMIDGQPAATVASACKCQSPAVNQVASGSKKVLIGGQSAARQGDATAHGGSITAGSSKVTIA